MIKTITLKSYKSKSLSGKISIPGDKSISIRAVIISSISYGKSKIFGILESEDVKNTIKSLKELEVEIKKIKNYYSIKGCGGVFRKKKNYLYFGNSGTGSRLMCGVLSSRNISVTIKGDSSLTNRPMLRILEPLRKMGGNLISDNGKLPIKIKKSEKLLPTIISSKLGSAQVKSAIILSALNIKGKTVLKEYLPSRNHTEIMLCYFGANLKVDKLKGYNKIIITGPNKLMGKNIMIPGDFSSASFIIVAVLLCINSKVLIKNVGLNYYRTGLLDILKKMNANITILNEYLINGEKVGDIQVESSVLQGLSDDGLNSTRMIDEYPILFVAASFARGTSIFKGLGELKVKESNRLNAMSEALLKSGVKLEVYEDSVKIFGNNVQSGGQDIDTHKDHRIAMSMIIFGLISEKPIKIDEIDMIFTSFPSFYDCLRQIGAKIEKVPK